jgi:hypothetical protein
VSGFIDVHTHAEEIGEHPFAVHFVRMGVTTVVADKGLVEGAMTGGAVGFSTGLQYVPGTYGDASDDRRRPDEGDAGRS